MRIFKASTIALMLASARSEGYAEGYAHAAAIHPQRERDALACTDGVDALHGVSRARLGAIEGLEGDRTPAAPVAAAPAPATPRAEGYT